VAQSLVVNQDVLRTSSARLLAAADSLDQARGRLEGRLSTLGQCWGTSDDVATQFVSDYVPGRDDVLDGCRELTQVLRELGDRTQQAGRTFAGVEADNAATAKYVARTPAVATTPAT